MGKVPLARGMSAFKLFLKVFDVGVVAIERILSRGLVCGVMLANTGLSPSLVSCYVTRPENCGKPGALASRSIRKMDAFTANDKIFRPLWRDIVLLLSSTD
ncbi:MAG TPA: hypothetical protein VIH03_02355 [Nitrososphaerales archaeon]